jgi:hypothetical protein
MREKSDCVGKFRLRVWEKSDCVCGKRQTVYVEKSDCVCGKSQTVYVEKVGLCMWEKSDCLQKDVIFRGQINTGARSQTVLGKSDCVEKLDNSGKIR